MHFLSRKKKLVKSRLQLRLTLAFLSLSILASLFQVFLLNRSLLTAAQGLPTDGDTLLRQLPPILGYNLALTAAVLVPVMLVVGILVTHRVAGPVYRMEQHLREWLAGEEDGPCQLRRGDEFQELCALLNQALEEADEEPRADETEPAPEEHAA